MIVELKNELDRISIIVGATFVSKSNAELQGFSQSYDFASPLINLKPIISYKQNIIAGGAIRYNFRFEIYFLTKFPKSDTLNSNKDVLIDEMILLSEKFYSNLNKNKMLYFINPKWDWTNEILRQYLSNLTLGVRSVIDIDTACNRI